MVNNRRRGIARSVGINQAGLVIATWNYIALITPSKGSCIELIQYRVATNIPATFTNHVRVVEAVPGQPAATSPGGAGMPASDYQGVVRELGIGGMNNAESVVTKIPPGMQPFLPGNEIGLISFPNAVSHTIRACFWYREVPADERG
jgi:hypothetical protein